MNDLTGRRYAMIVNPRSGAAAGVDQIVQLVHAIKSAGADLTVDVTRSAEHGQAFVSQCRSERLDGVIVVGGDGTVRPVLEALEGSGIAVLVIPAGTENLLATQYGLDGTCDQAMALLGGNRPIDMDLASVNGTGFMAVMGVGFDAEVIERMARGRHGHISHLDYFWPICRTFWEYRFGRFAVTVDGEERCRGAALVFVNNIARYAMGLRIAPDAVATDRKLDVTILFVNHHVDLIRHTAGIVLGKGYAPAMVHRQRCDTVRIESLDGAAPCQVDGDPGPHGPWEIAVRPAAVKLLVPEAPAKPGVLHYLKKWV